MTQGAPVPARARQAPLASLARRPRAIASLAAWSIAEAVPAYLSGLLVAHALDDGFLAGRSGAGFAWLAGLAVAILAGAWATRQVFLRLADAVEPLRDELARMVVAGAIRRAAATGSSRDSAAVARLTQQVEIVREAYASVLLVVERFVVSGAGAVVGLLSLTPLALVLVVPPLLVALVIFVLTLARMEAGQRASILADERVGEATDILARSLRDIAACGGEAAVEWRAGEHIEAQADATRRLARLAAARTVTIAVGGLLPAVLLVGFAPWLRSHGATTGDVVGALTYVLGGIQPVLQMLVRQLGGGGLWLAVTLRRLLEAAEVPAGAVPAETGRSRTAGSDPTASADGAPGCAVEMRRVTFAYGPGATPIVTDLDLAIPDGDHLAVIGPSGGGKSTLVNLMAGVLRPQSGEVRLRAVVPAEPGLIDPSSLRALVPQEAYVFAGRLQDNLAYLRPGAGSEMLGEVVDTLGVGNVVERLGGFDAEIVPSRLSPAERQIVALVRAYASPARLVLLDEASCHLDAADEARIEQAFRRRRGTLVVVAHRISSATRAKRILLLDGGRALVGTHAELLATSDVYRDLVGRWEPPPTPRATRRPSGARRPFVLKWPA